MGYRSGELEKSGPPLGVKGTTGVATGFIRSGEAAAEMGGLSWASCGAAFCDDFEAGCNGAVSVSGDGELASKAVESSIPLPVG